METGWRGDGIGMEGVAIDFRFGVELGSDWVLAAAIQYCVCIPYHVYRVLVRTPADH